MKSLSSKIVVALSVILITAGVFVLGSHFPNDLLMTPATANVFNQNSITQVLTSQDTITAVYNNASPAVVEIDVTQQGNGFLGGSTGQGSGFLIDNNGHIMTNNHVVQGASSVQVRLNNGTILNGTVLGTDAKDDLAIVSVDPKAVSGITPLKLADSSTVQIGQLAIAIGSPYGLTNTVSAGIISGLNRTLSGSTMTSMIQTDASLNPGNSGGPLLDGQGLVVGINTALEKASSGRIGFAVPSNVAQSVLSNLVAGKSVVLTYLGITGRDLTALLASSLNISVTQGVYVVSVVANSPADKTGLKGPSSNSSGAPAVVGDVITMADRQPVSTIAQLLAYIRSKNVGDVVKLTILRNGQTVNAQVTLEGQPSRVSPTLPQPSPIPNNPPR